MVTTFLGLCNFNVWEKWQEGFSGGLISSEVMSVNSYKETWSRPMAGSKLGPGIFLAGAHARSVEVVAALLMRNADPGLLAPRRHVASNSGTPLMWQVRRGRSSSVICLLENPRARDVINVQARRQQFPGYTALHLACCLPNDYSRLKEEVIEILLLHGANLLLRESMGRKPLDIVCKQRHSHRNDAEALLSLPGRTHFLVV